MVAGAAKNPGPRVKGVTMMYMILSTFLHNTAVDLSRRRHKNIISHLERVAMLPGEMFVTFPTVTNRRGFC